jgi:class 3 adenylate cyclase/tetratricopeptide (TPR) repeat protein
LGWADHTPIVAQGLLANLKGSRKTRAVAAEATCPTCGETNPPHAQFCNSCGARLEDVHPKQEERKLVSVLFVDLVGFTSRSDQADPEDVRDSLQLYHARAKEQIELYGGTVEKFIGDAVMAVFGAPVAHGDDAERAVRAGLRVLEAIEALNCEHALGLAARAAVNTGEAVVAVGGQQAGEALAIGDVVNTASRLQSAAPTGRLIVGEETYRATRHAFRYEHLDPVDAKGKKDPVTAWLAIEPSVAPSERPIAANPLVGRGREIELMRSVWERATGERRPHLVTVLGPPGIGKTRLCQEISALVAGDGGRIVRGRCLPYEGQTGYQAFSTILKETSGIFESDSQPAAREKLKVKVEELVPDEEAAEIARHLAFLVGVSSGISVVQPGLLFFAARRFLECLGLGQPTLVVFEDIHWAQSSELELLEYLAAHMRDTSVVLVALARPELLDIHSTWGGGLAAQTTIPLEPLTPADAVELAGHLLQTDVRRVSDVDRLVEVAEGNPLFIEELAASVVELDSDEELPVTVRAAIAARIDALPPEARTALLAAAVVGKTFWRDVLHSMRVGEDIDGALTVLETRDFVRRDPSSQMPGDAQFTFKHMLIREVAYATVPRATRRARHAAVASYIEKAGEGSTEALAWILAYHWREAGESSKAIPYLLAAAEVAQRGWAKSAAVDLYTTALELADDAETRRRIRLQRGLALVALGDFERAAEELGELLPELTGVDRLEALLGRGRATHWTERDVETLEIAAEAVALATELADEEGLPAAVALQAQGYAMAGEMDQALELGERALDEWVPETRPVDLTEHLHLHANVTYWAGHYDRCAEMSKEARALATDVHSAEALMRGGGTEALALAGLGQHEAAIRLWDELFAISRELGHNVRVLLNYSSLAFRELHDLAEARRRSEEALELSEGQSFGMPRRFAASDLLLTDLLAGDVGHAQAVWPKLWSDAQEATAWTKWLIYGRLATARAEIALAAESPETALEWAQRAIEIMRPTRRRKYVARSLTALGEACAHLGRRDEALRALHDSVALADQLIGPPARWDARAALGRSAYALGEDDEAERAYREAGELVENFAATLSPERAARLLAAPAIEEILKPAAAG